MDASDELRWWFFFLMPQRLSLTKCDVTLLFSASSVMNDARIKWLMTVTMRIAWTQPIQSATMSLSVLVFLSTVNSSPKWPGTRHSVYHDVFFDEIRKTRRRAALSLFAYALKHLSLAHVRYEFITQCKVHEYIKITMHRQTLSNHFTTQLIRFVGSAAFCYDRWDRRALFTFSKLILHSNLYVWEL